MPAHREVAITGSLACSRTPGSKGMAEAASGSLRGAEEPEGSRRGSAEEKIDGAVDGHRRWRRRPCHRLMSTRSNSFRGEALQGVAKPMDTATGFGNDSFHDNDKLRWRQQALDVVCSRVGDRWHEWEREEFEEGQKLPSMKNTCSGTVGTHRSDGSAAPDNGPMPEARKTMSMALIPTVPRRFLQPDSS